MSQFIYPR